MSTATGAMRWSAVITGLSAVLHLVAYGLSGLSADILWTLPAAVIYGGLVYGLHRGSRGIAYLAFVALLIGISLAASNIWAFESLTGWLFASIVATNLAGVAALFAALWNAPQPTG